jgi:hypothetical protein
MKTIALCIAAVSLAVGGSAFAAERAVQIPPPHCEPIVEMKASVKDKDVKFTILTPGQFHFISGVYVGSPITPPGGLPPGDGAILLEGKKGAGVIWTRGNDACITQIVVDIEHRQAAYLPLPVGRDLLLILKGIKSGKDETVAPDDSKDELKL